MKRGNRRLPGSAVIFLLAIFLVGSTRQMVYAQGYVDPRKSMSGFYTWCRSMGGTPYNDARGVGCIPGDARSSSGGFAMGRSNPYSGLFGLMGQNLNAAVSNMLNPVPGSMDSAALIRGQELQRKKAEELERQRQIEEQWRLQEEAKKKREFLDAKERMLGQMKGTPERGELKMKGMQGGQDLTMKGMGGASAPATAFQQAVCSAYLLQKADEAAGVMRFDEAVYLSNQASLIMGGASPGVQCPAPDNKGVSDVSGRPVEESKKAAEELLQRAKIYNRLYGRVEGEVVEWRDKTRQAQEAQQFCAQKDKAIEEAKGRLADLEAKKMKDQAGVSQNEIRDATMAVQKAKDESVKARMVLEEKSKALMAVENRMKETGNLFERAKNPDRWSGILQELAEAS